MDFLVAERGYSQPIEYYDSIKGQLSDFYSVIGQVWMPSVALRYYHTAVVIVRNLWIEMPQLGFEPGSRWDSSLLEFMKTAVLDRLATIADIFFFVHLVNFLIRTRKKICRKL